MTVILIGIIVITITLVIINYINNMMPYYQWYREFRGGKWWYCYEDHTDPFWIRSIHKPESLEIISYEDYDKLIF